MSPNVRPPDPSECVPDRRVGHCSTDRSLNTSAHVLVRHRATGAHGSDCQSAAARRQRKNVVVAGGEQDRADAAALVEGAAKVTGASVGAGVGLLIGGPPGAIAGAAVGSLVEVGADFAHRQLSKRQAVRTGTALGYAAERASNRLLAGDDLRDDGFFTLQGGRRPSDEVGEAVLSAVRDESEMRKVPFLGYLLANVGFEPNVDARSAHALIRVAQDLTYTQLCLLALVARKEEFALPASAPEGSHPLQP